MNVSHHSVVEFLEDLRYVVEDEREKPTVRADVDLMEVNDGVVEVTVVCGFMDSQHYYELSLPCGKMSVQGRKMVGEAEGISVNVINDIRKRCDELGVRVGGGRWQNA